MIWYLCKAENASDATFDSFSIRDGLAYFEAIPRQDFFAKIEVSSTTTIAD